MFVKHWFWFWNIHIDSSATSLIGYIDSSTYVILANNGSYMVSIDTSSYTCSGTQSLRYRIYEQFDDEAESCSEAVGSLYDPTVSCAYDSNSEFCTNWHVCNDTDYEYSCDFENYPYLCAVSDLSGKYGEIEISGNTEMISGVDQIMVDLSLLTDKSLVIQCSDDYSILDCVAFEEFYSLPSDDDGDDDGTSDDDDSSVTLRIGSVCVLIVSLVATLLF